MIKGLGGVGNKRRSDNYSNNSIIKISQNTEKSPGNFKRLAVIQTPVRNHQLMLVWKTQMSKMMIIKVYDMAPQSWIINCLKMYKISDEVINFIEKTMKTWRVELTAGRRSLAEAKIQRGIFQGDALSSLPFIIAMMPLNHMLRKCTAGYKLSKSQEKINHLIYRQHQTICKKWKSRNSNTHS